MVIELPVYSDSSVCARKKKSKICCALQGDLNNTGELVHRSNNIRTSMLGLIFKMGDGFFLGGGLN